MSIPKPVDCAVTDVAFNFLCCERLLMRRCDVTARVISMPKLVRVDVMDILECVFLSLFFEFLKRHSCFMGGKRHGLHYSNELAQAKCIGGESYACPFSFNWSISGKPRAGAQMANVLVCNMHHKSE